MPNRPDVAPGTVLLLAEGEWGYGSGPLTLRVRQVRWELAHHYGDRHVWIQGERLAADGSPVGPVQVLVPVEVLRRAGCDGVG